jgi:glycerol-3-phosphate acyltransferase PlsY
VNKLLLKYILIVVIGYLFGTSNMAWYIAKLKHVDLRAGGSGNLGASNATILLGKGAGALTFLHDALKVIVAALACSLLFPVQYAGLLAAAAGVVGHIFPFYLKFKGGKGFASFIGMSFIIDWQFGLIMIVALVIVAIIADWIVAGTFLHIVATPIYVWCTSHWIGALIVIVPSVLIFIKHIENIKRKHRGEEFSLRRVLFKKKKPGR